MSRHILVIGGGVIGLCIGWYCSRRGDRVTIVDRNPEEHDGCSFGNAGMVVPSHVVPLAAPGMVALGLKWMWNPRSPFYIKPRLDRDLIDWGIRFWRAATAAHVHRAAPLLRDLHMASRACFEELAGRFQNEFGLVQKGLLMLCKTAHTLDEEARAAEVARQLGIPAEVLDPAQTARLDPDVTMDIAGSVYFPKDCHLSPARFMEALRRELVRTGVRFVWETEVTGWDLANRTVRAVRTSHGELTADEYVLCSGAWSPSVARDLGLRIPIQAGKGYSLTVPRPRQLPRLCAIFTEARVAVTPMQGTLRFGGTMEIAGLNEEINPVRVDGIVQSVARYYPAFSPADFEGIQPWRGLRPCSPDGLPYIGRTGACTNVVVATGHAMMGLSLAPITGRLIAEILAGEDPGIPLEQLSPDRYA